MTGLDFDNGTEFLNQAVIKWASEQEVFFTSVTALQEERPNHHRVEEQPPGPHVRLLQEAELVAYRNGLNPANLARQIADLQTVLLNSPGTRQSSSTSPASPTQCPMSQRHPDQSLLTTNQAGIAT